MFEINFRLTRTVHEYFKKLSVEEIDSEGNIDGFFEMVFNNKSYGFYTKEPLSEKEFGGEYIDDWLDSLQKACIVLNFHSYVAISDVDSINSWIEFKKNTDENYLFVSNLCKEKSNEVFKITIDRLEEAKVLSWENEIIHYSEFLLEIIKKVEIFMEYLVSINNNFKKSKIVKQMSFLNGELKYISQTLL